MPTPLCRHVRTNGSRCGSPSLSNNQVVLLPHQLHHRHRNFRFTEAKRGYLIPDQHLELLALEDSESIQLAISMVINALATSGLDTKRASVLLYGLQLASANAARLQSRPKASDVVRDFATSPDGLDLAVNEYSNPEQDSSGTETEHKIEK